MLKSENLQNNRRLIREVAWMLFGVVVISFIFWRTALLIQEAALLLNSAAQKFVLPG